MNDTNNNTGMLHSVYCTVHLNANKDLLSRTHRTKVCTQEYMMIFRQNMCNLIESTHKFLVGLNVDVDQKKVSVSAHKCGLKS